MKNRYERPLYSKLLDRYKDTEQIKVLTGVRRCGKSTLLDLYREKLISDGVPKENIIHMRFDEFGVPLDMDASALQDSLTNAFAEATKGMVYVFLDEVQIIEGWEKVVRGLHARENTDIYITGSNAYLLSSDLATYIAGRYIEIKVFPLSFSEYIDFCHKTKRYDKEDKIDLFRRYMRYGGMPTLFALRNDDEQDIARELSAIYDSVIMGDVARRFSIRDYALLSKLVAYVFSTSGNLLSVQNLVNYLKSNGEKTTFQTIDNYLYALQQALILLRATQAGLQGKKLLRPLQKFYVVDTGLRNLSIRFALRDVGYQLESIVYVELLRRGFSVSVGSLNSSEIDFVASRNDETLYIQVCQNMGDDSVLERELVPLRNVHDGFPKVILTLDRLHIGVTSDGIKVKSLIEWLLEV
ncbi:MAG: ATP-binding protein [Eggerthellaceae bacterium]|nr:ATP-binding protein [Eggerthellaceae bacterium]